MTSTDHDEKPAGPPPYDAAAVGRVAAQIEIRNVELVYAHFERDDDGALASRDDSLDETTPEFFLDRDWTADFERGRVGFLLRFLVESATPPFKIAAFFRLTYGVRGEDRLDEGDLEQFASWNAVFNAWPYFREYVSSTANRAGLPRLVLPVMRVPR